MHPSSAHSAPSLGHVHANLQALLDTLAPWCTHICTQYEMPHAVRDASPMAAGLWLQHHTQHPDSAARAHVHPQPRALEQCA